MSPVFSHGRLRLYLLKLLDESPRHGYEVIRLLEDRFMGLYALPGHHLPAPPAPGGRGPGHPEPGGRPQGLPDHRRRPRGAGRPADELDELEAEISGSVHGLAREIRDEVRGTVQDLKQELRQAAREIRREQRHENRSRRDRHDDHHRWDWRDEGFDGRLAEFLDRTQRAMRRVQLTEAQVRECAAILDEAFERIRQTLKDTPRTTPDHRGANQ